MPTSGHSARKVIIIGTGPAGLTAAIYAARADLQPIVFEGKEPGGQLTLTTEVENFPGFPEGVQGPELMNNMRKQALRFGAEFISQQIVKVDLSRRPFTVVDDLGKELSSETLIISSGASAKMLGLDHERELIGRGVSTCATCDGFFYRDRVVHVVGGGDTALEEATFLTKFASHVYVIHRRGYGELRASKIMVKKAEENPKLSFLWNSAVEELVYNDSGLTGIKVRDLISKEIYERKTDGLFYGIGHTPNTSFLEGQIQLDSHGYIQTRDGVETNVPGVFACGDVQDSYYRQAITAAGSGCQAALKAERFLE